MAADRLDRVMIMPVHLAVAPLGTAMAIVADEVAFGVNGQTTMAMAAHIDLAGRVWGTAWAGVGGAGSEPGERGEDTCG